MGWSNQAVSLIVLTEATGGYSGMFGYSPTPGPNNLVFSLTAAALTDPYGNQVPSGLTVYNPAPNQGICLNLQFAGVYASMSNADGEHSQQGAWTTYVQYYQDADVFFTTTPVAVQKPGAAAGTPEEWHDVTPPTNWTGTLRYKMTDLPGLLVQCNISTSAAVSGTQQLFTVEDPYIPATAPVTFPIRIFASAVTDYNADLGGQVTTAGVVQAIDLPASVTLIDFVQEIPLD